MTRAALAAAIGLLAAGCIGLPAPSAPSPVVVPAPPPPPPPTVRPTTVERPPVQPPPAPPDPEPPTVITEALVERARDLEIAGSSIEAAAAIEQAIRIEPRRGELWLQLAAIRLRDGRPGMAEQSARKALLFLAAGSADERKAWLVIAQAREYQGDSETAAGIRDRWAEP